MFRKYPISETFVIIEFGVTDSYKAVTEKKDLKLTPRIDVVKTV
jgi:hypothetical protein